MTFFALDENGNQVPHSTELISYGRHHQSVAVVSEEGKRLLRANPTFLKTVAAAQRTGKEVGEGWEGKVHWEEVKLLEGSNDATDKVAVKYYFPCVLKENESSYDGVLYGMMTPGIDQMRVLQYIAQQQKKTGIFPGVEFVVPYFATIDVTVAPLVPHAINLEKEFRKFSKDPEKILHSNIAPEDKKILLSIFEEQDKVLLQRYKTIDPERRFTTLFSNAGYNIIRGITAWLNTQRQYLIDQGLVISPEKDISFYDATQKNIVVSIPKMEAIFALWKDDPSIADNWIQQRSVQSLEDPLLDDPFLHMVREASHVIEVMVTNRVIGRIGDGDP